MENKMQWMIFLGIYILPVLLLLVKPAGKKAVNGMLYMSKDHTTIAKGLAMFCVMLCHYMGHFGGGVTYFTPLGGTGVAAFLILSGYGLNESWKKRSTIPVQSRNSEDKSISPFIIRGGVFQT